MALSPTTQQPVPSLPTELAAVVTEIRELQRIDGRQLFQIALSRSPFQPGDAAGTVTATSRLGNVLVAPITAVEQDSTGELWHTTAKPLQPGTPVVARVATRPAACVEG